MKFTSAAFEFAKSKVSILALPSCSTITDEPAASSYLKAFMHRIHGRCMRGNLVECDGIWKRPNEETGVDYCVPRIRDLCLSAIRGTAANLDVPDLQAVVP